MSVLHFPWLVLAILVPLFGTIWVGRSTDQDVSRRRGLWLSGISLLLATGAWIDFRWLGIAEATDAWDPGALLGWSPLLSIDELSAPLLPLAALVYFVTLMATPGAKLRVFSFSWVMLSLAILLATFSSKQPWMIVTMLALGTIPPWIELKRRGKSTRVFTLHMTLFTVALIAGQFLMSLGGSATAYSLLAVALLIAAVLIRSGVVPVHCWMPDLFENASFGTALLFVTPMVDAYGTMRLVMPVAPDWALRSIAVLSLITAVYAAGMALVQREARRFFCYLFLSHSSLVLVGLEIATPIGLTGALCVWVSVCLSMAGFGLVLRCVEARTGPLSLDSFHGLYVHVPHLAGFFLLTGLSSIGFPGTVGFVGVELLVDGAVMVGPLVGACIVIAAALNGLAVLHAYFRVFTGSQHTGTIDIGIRLPERIAVLVLSVLILAGGIFPQPGVSSRYEAAIELLTQRAEHHLDHPPDEALDLQTHEVARAAESSAAR